MRSLLIILFLSVLLLTVAFHSGRFPFYNGLMYQKIGWDQKAREMFDTACNARTAQGCVKLGIMYENGDAGYMDNKEAKRLYEQGCKQKDGEGCYRLARLYSKSDSLKEALQVFSLYQTSCDYDYGKACNLLGQLETDPLKARELFEKARSNGSVTASRNLASMYEEGNGTAQDLQKAFDLYKEGCDREDGAACLKLGHMYYYGEAADKDIPAAKKFYDHACRLENQEGCVYEALLKNETTR